MGLFLRFLVIEPPCICVIQAAPNALRISETTTHTFRGIGRPLPSMSADAQEVEETITLESCLGSHFLKYHVLDNENAI